MRTLPPPFYRRTAASSAIFLAALLAAACFASRPAAAEDGVSTTEAGATQAAWSEYLRAGRFHVFSDTRVDREAPIWKELESLPERVESALGLPHRPTAFRVYLLRSRTRYQSVVARRFPDGIDRRALYIADGDRHEIFVYRHLEFVTDLRHEAVHAVLHAALPYLPLWLDEGLAAYFETPPGQSPASHPYRRRLRWDWILRRRPDLRRLEQIDDPMKLSAADYRECWGWTFFLLSHPETRDVLQQYLRSITEGQPPGRFSEFLQRRIGDPPAVMMQTIKNPPSAASQRHKWLRWPFGRRD